jgi:para-nitrobenzyl esterase
VRRSNQDPGSCRISQVAMGLSLLVLGSSLGSLCRQHFTQSECILFREQHQCVWHATTGSCLADTPCDARSAVRCQTELTTGEKWDVTTNKCFWDSVRGRCRFSDECTALRSLSACTLGGCTWEMLCTPADQSKQPGPNVCSSACQPLANQTNHPVEPRRGVRHQHVTARSPEATGPVVHTTNGDVQGFSSGANVIAFLGIPFAQSPVGDARWSAPVPMSKWNGTYQATAFGPACSQNKGYYFSDPSLCQGYTRATNASGSGCRGYSEDCLTLNVWTPAADTAARAVLVWIHGGCFTSGSASNPLYNGTALSAAHDVVVVSVQYRLGVFGWLGAESLRTRDPTGSTGNYGLMDNVAALSWLHDNIAAFGGSPDRVTIFGESSGAGSVSHLLGVEAAWPFFQKGIMESGTGSFWSYITLEAAHGSFEKVLSATGCQTADDQVSCVVGASSAQVAGAVSAVPCRDGCTWAPVVDGVYVRANPLDLAKSGKLRPSTATISGFNQNDGAMFVPGFPISEAMMSSSSLASYFSDRFGPERLATLSEIYPVPKATAFPFLSKYFYAAQECETDFSYRCSALWFSNATATLGDSAFVYKFSEPSSLGLVLHGDEIGYVFGSLSAPSTEQQAVSSNMMGFWANFAKTGDPNGPGLPKWPEWGATGSLLNITSPPAVAHVTPGASIGCSFFQTNWAFYGGCLPPS